MHPDQIKLVQSTFAQVLPIADVAATLFYNRLFDLDPSLRSMFRSDMQEQGRKLMTMLKVVVNGLSRLEELLPAVRNLGERHVSYGVRNHHYETVGAALLWTLRQGLGEAFTPEVEAAWASAYTLLVEVMKESANKQYLPLAA